MGITKGSHLQHIVIARLQGTLKLVLLYIPTDITIFTVLLSCFLFEVVIAPETQTLRRGRGEGAHNCTHQLLECKDVGESPIYFTLICQCLIATVPTWPNTAHSLITCCMQNINKYGDELIRVGINSQLRLHWPFVQYLQLAQEN